MASEALRDLDTTHSLLSTLIHFEPQWPIFQANSCLIVTNSSFCLSFWILQTPFTELDITVVNSSLDALQSDSPNVNLWHFFSPGITLDSNKFLED